MTQPGICRAPQSGPWQPERFDLQAYWQQLSYPQLLSPGRAEPGYRPHATRIHFASIGGAAAAACGAWHRLHRASR